MERVRWTRASNARTVVAPAKHTPDRNWPRLARDPLAIFACLALAACSLGGSDYDASLRRNGPDDPAAGGASTTSPENEPGKHDPQPLADPMTLVPAYTEYLGRLTGTNQNP